MILTSPEQDKIIVRASRHVATAVQTVLPDRPVYMTPPFLPVFSSKSGKMWFDAKPAYPQPPVAFGPAIHLKREHAADPLVRAMSGAAPPLYTPDPLGALSKMFRPA